jgi:hypothetical protein
VGNGIAHFVQLSLIIEGASEKVTQLIISLKSINNKNVCLLISKMYYLSIAGVNLIKLFYIMYAPSGITQVKTLRQYANGGVNYVKKFYEITNRCHFHKTFLT